MKTGHCNSCYGEILGNQEREQYHVYIVFSQNIVIYLPSINILKINPAFSSLKLNHIGGGCLRPDLGPYLGPTLGPF